MRELIGRLDVVDDDAASALRVIAHFDGLVDERASGPAMVRAAAALAGCPAAWHDSDSGVTRRVDPAGRPLGPAGWQGGWPRVTLDTGRDGAVWLERSDEPGPLDRLILERLGKALDTTAGPRADTGRVAHAVRVACDPDLTVAERRPAVETLGLAGSVTVWAVRPASVSLSARRQAPVDGVAVVLLDPPRHGTGSASVDPGRVGAGRRGRPAARAGARPDRAAAQWVSRGTERDQSLRGPRRAGVARRARPARAGPGRPRTSPPSNGSCPSTPGWPRPSPRSSATGVCGRPLSRCTCTTPRSRSGSPGSRAGSGSRRWADPGGSAWRSPCRCGGSPARTPAEPHTSERVGRQRRTRVSASASRSTFTVPPSRTSPDSRALASRSPISFCTNRRSGRAP